MAADEEELLRSVALQNANAILAARRRAEEELARARDALEANSAELARSLATTRAILETALDGIITCDHRGVVLEFNPAAERTFGYRRDEAVGRDLADLIVPARFRDAHRRGMAHYLATGEGPVLDRRVELPALRRDGTEFPAELAVTRIPGDGPPRFAAYVRDVTDRRAAEEALKKQAEWWRVTLASVGDAVITTDTAGRVTSLNPVAESLTGWAQPDARGLPLERVFHIVNEETRRPVESPATRALREGRIVGLANHTVLVARDGTERAIDDSAAPIKDERGEVAGVVLIFRDVSDRRRDEERLRRSEAQFRQLADAMPQIVWAARPDGYVDYYNERWYEFTGFPRGEYGDQSWEPILHPDDVRRTLDAYYGCVRSGGLFQIEYRFRDRRTGGYRWFLGRAVPVRDEAGSIVRWFGTCTDVDDTKRAEEATRFLADASAALAELTDYESTLQKVAALAVPFFADWCAVDVRDADGPVRRLAVAHADPAKVQLAHDLFRRYPPRPDDPHGTMKVLRTGEPEWVAVIPDGLLAESARDAEHLRITRELGLKSYVCVPLRSRGRVLGALTFVTAESGRVYDAGDLRAAEDLAHRAAVAVENAALVAALRETDRRKDEFLAILAHELRNPLAPVRNAVEILRAKAPPVPELQWARDVIDRQVGQMTRLVDDLMDVSRITRGKVTLRRERVDLTAVVRDAVEAARPLVEKGGHELTVEVPSGPVFLQADPTRLAQVLLNLLNNAAKYTDPGGHIRLAAEQTGGRVLIRVEDTGVGIPADMLPRVFDLFTQVDRTLERSQGGLGIGLTLVKSLVEMHGGTVEARSPGPGRGSEFVVRLPAAGETADRGVRPTGADGEDAIPSPRRILVVDDNRDAADSLAMLLRLAGHEVRTAHDGLEAVGAAAVFGPDVVLLDIGLPKLNGYEAARRIRGQKGGEVLLVALTGWGQEEDRRLSKEAGFDHHLTKPVDFGALQALLTQSDWVHPEGSRK